MGKAKLAVKRYWKRCIEEFKTSGVSKVAYCRAHELTYHQFLYWHDKLTKTCKAKATQLPFQQNPLAEPKSLHSAFVPVKLQPENLKPNPAPAMPKTVNASSSLLCTFEMQQGHKILIYSIAALERTLSTLNSDISKNHRAN